MADVPTRRNIADIQNNKKEEKDEFFKNEEDTPDGDTLEKYDEFYRTTKSLLVLFQLMGIMPIMRNEPGVTTYSNSSATAIFAYVIFGAETVYVIMVFNARLEITMQKGNRFDEYIYNVIFLSILIPHFVLPVAAWRNGPEVAKFKNMWAHFQVRFVRVTGSPLQLPQLSVITWTGCILSWSLSIAIVISEYLLQPNMYFWHTFGYYHIFATLNGLASLWFVNCTSMGIACKGMARSLHQALDTKVPASELASYRHLWDDLSQMMQQLGKAYSNMYGMYCLVILFTTIIATYGSLTEVIDNGLSEKEYGLFIIMTYCMSILYIICNEAYHASRKVRYEFQDRLLAVNLGAVDPAIRKEVDLFLTLIQKNPPIMNLNNYINIDRELITTTVSTMTTYLVVLMQFKMTLVRQQQSANDAITEAPVVLSKLINGTKM